jgi:uncharacterized protein YcfJ
MMTRLNSKILLIGTSLIIVSMALSACSNSREDKKLRSQVIGGATGAAVGSLFGSGSGKAAMVGVGAVLGTVVGGKVADKN